MTRQARPAAKRYALLFVITALCATWSAGRPLLAAEPGTLTLSIGIFSGRPNPELNLEQAEAAVVLQMLSEASPAPAEDCRSGLAGRLAYSGVGIARWGTNNLIDWETHIRGTNIVVGGGGLEQTCWRAQDTRLEDYLLNLAYERGAISFELYDYILCEINPKRREFVVRLSRKTSDNHEVTLDWPCVPGRVAVLERPDPAAGAWRTVLECTSATNCTVVTTNTSGFFKVLRCFPWN